MPTKRSVFLRSILEFPLLYPTWKSLILAGLVLIGVFMTADGMATASPMAQSAEEGKTIFQAKCSACHTVGGGKLVGPDLQGVTAQRDLQRIKDFILDPNAVFAAGDPTAAQLLKEYNNVKMPKLGLSNSEVEAVIAYLENPGAPGANAAAHGGPNLAGDPATGEKLFTGQQQLANGGTSCLSCHSVNDVGSLGGGTLGPDLTQVFTRYGENGLNAALKNIAFPTMAGIFASHPITPQEQAHLTEFFKQVNQRPPAPAANTWVFPGIALALMGGLFGMLLIFWPGQRQSISDRLRKGDRNGKVD